MRLLLVLMAWLMVFIHTGYSQKINGKVIDAKSSEPLPGANVFINQTTIGTVTVGTGDFELSFNQEPGEYELVISFVGYLPLVTKVSWDQQNVNVGVLKLVPSEQELKQIDIAGTRDTEWEKKLKRFNKVFLGSDKQASQCKILNPWVIDFEETGNVNELRAKASEPIEIVNNALGYQVVFYLANLWSTKDGYIIAGNARFSELSSKDSKQIKKWKEARKKAYLRSTHHLFRSMIENRIKGEGFRLYTAAAGYKNSTTRSDLFYSELGKTVVPYDTAGIVFRNLANDTYVISLNGSVEVHYLMEAPNLPLYADVYGSVSWINLNRGSVTVNKDGFPLNPTDVVVSGDMSADRVAKMLPLDYRPDGVKSTHPELYDWSRFQEQIYVHTDKPYYYIGDTIWMKGYVGYSHPMWRDSLSRTAYVELVDRTNQLIVASKIIKLDSGLFFNELVIPSVPETRNYYLRVYTNLNRNFGDNTLYVKPIPILYSAEYLKLEQEIEPITQSSGISLEPATSNPIPGKPYELLLQINDQQGEPLASHFSVSVTDMAKVVPVQISDPIQKALTLNNTILKPFKKSLDYPIEYGISFSVKPQGVNKTNGVYQIVQVDQPNFTMADLTADGLVHIKGLVFYDTGRFVLQPMEGKKNNQLKYSLVKRAIVPISFQDIDLKLKRERLEAGQGNNLTEEQLRNTKVLRDVQVKANRTTVEKPLDRVERPFGKPDYVITRQQLNTSYGNLLQTLPGKVPGLIVRQGSNPNGAIEWFVYLAKGGESSSALNPAEVLVTINDVVVTGKPEQILSAIDPNSVETIEVKTGVNVLYGSLGGNGILAVYTRKDYVSPVDKPDLVTTLRVPGYAIPKAFKQRLTSVPATVYWNPWMKTNAVDGKAIIKFNAPLFSGKYRIVVEGINSLGEPFSIQKTFEVVE